jgi:hypothetical protein
VFTSRPPAYRLYPLRLSGLASISRRILADNFAGATPIQRDSKCEEWAQSSGPDTAIGCSPTLKLDATRRFIQLPGVCSRTITFPPKLPGCR